MSELRITEVKVHRVKPEKRVPGDPLLGFARIVLNGELVINGLRIVDGRAKIFISFPRDHDKETGEHHGIVFPIKKALMDEVTARVLQEFAKT